MCVCGASGDSGDSGWLQISSDSLQKRPIEGQLSAPIVPQVESVFQGIHPDCPPTPTPPTQAIDQSLCHT